MSYWSFILRGLAFHWRVNLGVALSVAAATAVLTGALLVGDSVRGSLRALTLDRLGAIDEVLLVDRFFRRTIVDELQADEGFRQSYSLAVPVIAFPLATVERQGGGSAARASGVFVVGCNAAFWDLDKSGIRPATLPGSGEIVLNQIVADELRVEVGGQVVLRLPKSNQVPADSPLASKTDRIRNVVLKVVDIVPAQGLGRFSLTASQQLSRNVYVALELLQQSLSQPDKVNAILVSGSGDAPPDEAASRRLAAALKPSLEDLGLVLARVQRTFESEDGTTSTIFDYFQLTTDRMILSPEAVSVAQRAFGDLRGQGVMTYLANSIDKVSPSPDAVSAESLEIPYSTITAIDLTDGFPLLDEAGRRIGPLAIDEIVLNSWAAESLDVRVGERLRIGYFAPETTHGQAIEEYAEFRLKAITPLIEPTEPYSGRPPREAVFSSPPTLANDPRLTPLVQGITDQESIADWDPPFPFDQKRVHGDDDEYWENHRTTPKAFVSLDAGASLWGSRFGRVTSIRVPSQPGIDLAELAARFETARGAESFGLEFRPIKRLQLRASSGTTPFDGLFLGLSFFIISAALLLVALLFRLGVEQHADEIGILLAVGLRRRQAGWLLVGEGLLVALLGGALGVAIGIGYARLMIEGLRTWWLGAITTPFLEFYYSPRTLVVGYGLGVLVSVIAIAWSVRQMRRISVTRLLAGQATDVARFQMRRSQRSKWVSNFLIVLAIGLSTLATRLVGMAQAGAFFAAGSALLSGLLLWIWGRLRQSSGDQPSSLESPFALSKLAFRNVARNPSRSAITIGLMAAACFLIVAMSSFRLSPTSAGTGGFDLAAESADPLFADLGSESGRSEALAEQVEELDGTTIFGLRLRGGDDASCNNLYKPTQPRVIGVTPEFISWFDNPDVQQFAWAASSAATADQKANPWRLLADAERSADEPIPVVIDMNTAMYSLGLPPGTGSEYVAEYEGATVRFRVVGLLSNSLLQGCLLIGAGDFEQQFPDIGGFRYFLIQSAAGSTPRVAEVLEETFGDQGFDAIPSEQILAQLLQVQNTYLSTFQSLGALGLLLGTFGLAAVQLRNIAERRGELAVLRACGYRRRRLAQMIFLENLFLLLGGLGTGCLAALLVVLPHRIWGDAAISLDLIKVLAAMLAAILLVGVISSLLSVRAALRAPVLSALRGD